MDDHQKLSYSIIKLLETYGVSSKLLIANDPFNIGNKLAVFCCNCVVHVLKLGPCSDDQFPKQPCIVRRTLELPSKIRKILNLVDSKCIVFLTVDGGLWKTGYDFIFGDLVGPKPTGEQTRSRTKRYVVCFVKLDYQSSYSSDLLIGTYRGGLAQVAMWRSPIATRTPS